MPDLSRQVSSHRGFVHAMLISDLVLGPSCLAEAMREPHGIAAQVLAAARAARVRLWLATGAIEAYRSSATSAAAFARLAGDCQWLSTLPGDVDPGCDDPIRELCARGVRRLGALARVMGRNAGETPPEVLLTGGFAAQPMAFIDLAAQQDRLRAVIEDRIHRVLHHGHYIMGPEIAELETRLAAYVGVKHCLTAASGTDTLEIAMRALDIGPGDEVITTPFTWISTAETIAQLGATPVFVDIEPDHFNIDVAQIEAAITPRTKAVMPVSLFGQMPDLDRINAIATRHGVPVIEDAAQSFGATQRGRRSCGLTTIGSTSFFPAKPLGCYGDAGALFTNDDALAAKMRAIRTHGGEKRHHHPYIGMNGRMDTVQAAVVLAKLGSWDWEVAQRGRLGARYSELLARLPNVRPLRSAGGVPVWGSGDLVAPGVAAGNSHVYAQYTIRAHDRDAVMERLKAASIPHSVYYPKCLHEQPCFARCGKVLGDFPEAERASREVISLPMHPDLGEGEIDRVVAALIA